MMIPQLRSNSHGHSSQMVSYYNTVYVLIYSYASPSISTVKCRRSEATGR